MVSWSLSERGGRLAAEHFPVCASLWGLASCGLPSRDRDLGEQIHHNCPGECSEIEERYFFLLLALSVLSHFLRGYLHKILVVEIEVTERNVAMRLYPS